MIYKVTGNGVQFSVERFNADKHLEAIPADTTVTLENTRYGDSYLIKGGFLYEYGSVSARVYYREENRYSWGSGYTSGTFFAAGGELFGIRDGALGRYEAVKNEMGLYEQYDLQMTSVGLTATAAVSMGSYLVVTETIDGTQTYKVSMDGGRVVKELIDEKSYPDGLIVVKPLN